MSNKIKLGFVGGGNDSLIGVLHKVAAVMFDRYHLIGGVFSSNKDCLLYTSPSPRDKRQSRMPSSA